MKRNFLIILLIGALLPFSGKAEQQNPANKDIWKVGIARKKITPRESVWMAGFAARKSPSEGTIHDLWAKALMLEDVQGNRSLLITMDLLGMPKDFSDELRKRINKEYGLDKSQIILSCSHTHSGPVISRTLKYIYPMGEGDWITVDRYTAQLAEMLFQLAGEAMKETKPARIYTQSGITRFQVNRRKNVEGFSADKSLPSERNLLSTISLEGPNDYSVPVIKIEGADKKLMAIIFGYACHPTTLSLNKFSGDYPGFAQIELEKLYPGTTAMFFQGAGADLNAFPRLTLPLSKQYGKQLAATVERILSEKMDLQQSVLVHKYNEISLPLAKPLPIEQLEEMAQGNDYHARWARGILDEYKQNGKWMNSYPAYPIQYWKIGNQSLFVLGGELLVSYGLRLKEMFGQDIFVMGYANNVMAYIPSATVIEEGGYEGDTSQHAYGLPAKWDKQIEPVILKGMEELVLNAKTN